MVGLAAISESLCATSRRRWLCGGPEQAIFGDAGPTPAPHLTVLVRSLDHPAYERLLSAPGALRPCVTP
jgi:hypothetical protein